MKPKATGLRTSQRLALVIALLVVFVLVGVVAAALKEPPEKFCAGVGLMGPQGKTPEQAFTRLLSQTGRDRTDWRRADRSPRSVSFTRKGGSDSERYGSIHVSLQPNGSWIATGACVDGPG